MSFRRNDAIQPVPGALLLSLIAVATYLTSLTGEFFYDDAAWVVNNPTIQAFHPLKTLLFPPEKLGISGRPITNLTFAVSYALSGLQPWGYHLVNILIHAACVVVLFGLARRTLQSPVLPETLRTHANEIGFCSALVWAIYPLNSIVVSYVAQRSESLMALFYLLTLFCFATAPRRPGWLGLSALSCFTGIASKEGMVTAPLIVLLFDRTFVAGTFRAAWKERWRYYLVLASSWLLLGWLMLGLNERGVGYDMGVTWWNYALTQFKALTTYLQLSVWPAPLMLDRGQSVLHTFAEAAPYAFLVAVSIALVLLALRRNKPIGFAGAWFFLVLAPSSSVVPIIHQPIGENRVYLPLVAVSTMLIALGWAQIGRRLLIAVGVAAVAMIALTTVRNRAFRTEVAVWRDVVAKQPGNSRAYYNIGVALEHRGRRDEAVAPYERAIQLDPTYAKAENNLGAILYGRGEFERALALYQDALAHQPNFAEAHTNLATALSSRGRYDEAIEHYRRAVEIAPELEVPWRLLGQSLLLAGKSDEAEVALKSALKLDPNDADANHDLGVIFFQRKQYGEAVDAFTRAVAGNPQSAQALSNLSAALLALNRPADAAAAARRAVQLKPGSADCHYNLAASLLGAGQFENAVPEFEAALRLDPRMASADNNLGVCWLRLGHIDEAIAAFNAALAVDPNFTDARNNLQQARSVKR